ncbi:hypothetical protein H9P43_003781 [Blastocladiella emersonii ATCC 22665]|nr:hypothetical protein H9P43_003781 [Blastocladiella emersonii ATCC 22665]
MTASISDDPSAPARGVFIAVPLATPADPSSTHIPCACTHGWRLAGALVAPVPCSVFLVRHPTAVVDATDTDTGRRREQWTLIDGGCPGSEQTLVPAIEAAIGADGEVAYVAVTHAHLDHIATVPAILARWPAAKVVAHPREVPYLTGAARFRALKGDTALYNCARFVMQESKVRVPAVRILGVAAHGESGTASAATGEVEIVEGSDDSAPAVQHEPWEAKSGLRMIETPGHTPGSVSYLHEATRTLFVGDALMYLPPTVGTCKQPVLTGPLAMSTYSMEGARASIAALLAVPDWDYAYPAHNADPAGRGLARIQIEAKYGALVEGVSDDEADGEERPATLAEEFAQKHR